MLDAPNAVEMRGIGKRFPGVLANDAVDFTLCKGEIHALLGENGAGKSTLMNILTGLYRPNAGVILVDGHPVSFRSPRDAIAHGIGMVHQHFMLVPTQTVAENVLLGLPQPRFFLRLHDYERAISDLGERYGLQVDPQSKIWQLSVGEQQRVEILKMLYRGASVLILDEPTAVLAPQEIEGLFETLRAMTAEGKSIVFISHKLHEVMAIADRITVLRKGKVTAAGLAAGETTKAELARLMVGREVLFTLDKKHRDPGEIVLEIDGLKAVNDKGLPALKGVSLHVRSGEIVGLAGIAGNGQSELAEVITGLRPSTGGRILLHGKVVIGGDAGRHARSRFGAQDDQRRDVAYPGRPDARGHGPQPECDRQPDPEGLSPAADCPRAGDGPRTGTRALPRAAPGVRDHGPDAGDAGAYAVRREPAAADPGQGDFVQAQGDDRHAADAWPGRRSD